MKFQFPEIRNIGQILPVIKDREEFVVAERDLFTVIDYQVSMIDTFPHIADGMSEEDVRFAMLRRECRGLKFSLDGDLLARPYHKFFNIGERPETMHQAINWSEDFSILDKLDGSMIHPILVNYDLLFCTRMGLSDVALSAQAYVEADKLHKIDYVSFCLDMIHKGMTPIFEWCSANPMERIVIKHPESRLVLTGLRHNLTGEYLTPLKIKTLAARYMIPLVGHWKGDFQGIETFMDEVRHREDEEGYVIWFQNGAVKIKNEWYLRIHKAKDMVRFEKDVIRLHLTNKMDDVYPFLLEDDIDHINEYTAELDHGIENTIKMVDQYVNSQRERVKDFAQREQNKEFARVVMRDFAQPLRSVMFDTWNGHKGSTFNVVTNAILDKTYSQTQVDERRPLHGANWWN